MSWMLRTAAGQVGRDSIAELSNGAMSAGTSQHDVRGAQRVAVGVANSDGASDEAHAVEIIHVIADIDDVGRVDAALAQDGAQTIGLVREPLLKGQSQLAAPRFDHPVAFGREHEQVEAEPAQALNAEAVAPIARHKLLTVFVDPHPVVGHDSVEVEHDQSEICRKGTAGALHHAVQPPSSTRLLPVMYDEASESRNNSAAEYSCESAMRASTVRAE